MERGGAEKDGRNAAPRPRPRWRIGAQERCWTHACLWRTEKPSPLAFAVVSRCRAAVSADGKRYFRSLIWGFAPCSVGREIRGSTRDRQGSSMHRAGKSLVVLVLLVLLGFLGFFSRVPSSVATDTTQLPRGGMYSGRSVVLVGEGWCEPPGQH